MAKSQNTSERGGLGRRGFLKGAATGAAALVTTTHQAEAQAPGGNGPAPAPAPTQAALDREAGNIRPPSRMRKIARPGSDLMVQTIKELGIEFVAANPGSSFEGLQESFINYGNPPNAMPEFITALHEESAVTMAHGYAKAEGKPMLALLHGTIGIQHGAMSIYQAYHDRTPVLMIAGNDPDFIQAHTAHDMAGMVRSFTKWDSQPKTLDETLRAIQRAYNEAVTAPIGPTLVVIDSEIQKDNAVGATVPKYVAPAHKTADSTQVTQIAKGLVEAQNPRIAVGRLRTPEGVERAVELAELVGASTSTAATSGPMSFPQRHPLCGPGASTEYDYTLGLERSQAGFSWELAQEAHASIASPLTSKISGRDPGGIGFGGLDGVARGSDGRRNSGPVIEADAEASIPLLIEEVKRQLTADKKARIQERTAKHARANRDARVAELTLAVEAKRAGWNGSPISTARLYAELWPLIANEDWCLASPTGFSSSHNDQLWDHNRPYSYLGNQGAGGMGYGLQACVGAALAARSRNRIVVNIQTDGDLNYAPGALWTAVHHKLPMLTVMHNNRAWHQEFMFVEYMAGVRGRGGDRAHIGSTLRDPFIDYAKMAGSYGMAGEGPITDPAKLSAALRRGVAAVKGGEPYLIDVITQPR